MIRRTLVWLVVLVLLCAALPSAAQHRRRRQPSAGGLHNKLASVRQRKAHLRAELHRTKVQANVVVSDIEKVDRWLGDVQQQLEETNENLDTSKSEQKHVASQLLETTKSLDQTREKMRKRLRAMYVRGEGSYISALIATPDAGDFASRGYLFQRIAHADRHLFDEYVALRKAMKERKRRQDYLVHKIAGLAENQRHQKDSLREAREQKQDSLASLKQKQTQIQAMISQFEHDEASIQSEIVAYMAAARERERERARQNAAHPHSAPPPLVMRGRLSRPINGPLTGRFGMRYHPILHIVRMHAGCDFGARTGTPIMAAGDGVVIATAYMRGYGNTVIIDHGNGLSTVYAHTSRMYVHRGQEVHRGQRIAAVGSTGLATGPHLHFEVRVNGRAVNPLGRF